jgi:crossover junction endodeoxyribonuclease RusA
MNGPSREEVSITVSLPFPPSANRLWRHSRGRVHVSSEYARWLRQADAAVQDQDLCKCPMLGRHVLEVQLSTRLIDRCDADNRVKAVLDWCQRAHLIDNDRNCRKASVEWANIAHECTVTLTGEIAYCDRSIRSGVIA